MNPTTSAPESNRSDALSSLFSVFYSSSQWSQWRLRPGAVPDSRTLLCLPPSLLSSLPPSVLSILYLSSPPGSLPDSAVPSAFTLDTYDLCFSIFILPSQYVHLSPLPSFTHVFAIHLLSFLSLSFCLSSYPSVPSKETAPSVRCYKNRSC